MSGRGGFSLWLSKAAICGRRRLGLSFATETKVMKYFIPDIRLSAELPIQTSVEEKLGGLPWGISDAKWPICRNCQKSMSLLAQFVHHPQRLNLEREGRTLNIFQCNHDPGMCSTWEMGSGANACLVVEPEELTPRLATLPRDKPLVEREARIVAWLEREDDLLEADAARFFSWNEFSALPEEVRNRVTTGTRLGGVPFWIQSPDEGPSRDWKFAGQLDSVYSFYTAPHDETEGISADRENWEGRTHICEGPNFGDGGIAYLFLQANEGTPRATFFWQCG
jgi:hypothetical protein